MCCSIFPLNAVATLLPHGRTLTCVKLNDAVVDFNRVEETTIDLGSMTVSDLV
jgi:hypothetical protein